MRRWQEDVDAIVGVVLFYTIGRTHERAVLRVYLNATIPFVGFLVAATDSMPCVLCRSEKNHSAVRTRDC